MRGPRARRQAARGGIVALLAIMALAHAAPVFAQENPPSAADQYAELVPSAEGPQAPGVERETRTPLPPAGSDAVEQAPSAIGEPLEEIATSSNYGAPTTPRDPKPTTREPDPISTDTSLAAAFSGTVDAVGSTEDGRLVGLLVAMLLTMVGAVALAFRRAR